MRVFDDDARELTAGYKAAVTAALPDNIICPTAAFWRELSAVVEDFLVLSKKPPPKCELEHWRRITAMMDELTGELRKVRRSLWWGDRAARALSALWLVQKDLIDVHIAGYEALADPKLWRGRANPRRQFLYGAVLNLWHLGLGLELQYSRSEKGTPGGPLIRFFAAVVAPMLGEQAPTVHGIAKIIDREKARILLQTSEK
jgi:hypothetical protein